METVRSGVVCLSVLNVFPSQRAVVQRATGEVVRFAADACSAPIGLWQRHPSGTYMIWREPCGARLRYPGAPDEGVLLSPQARIWPLRGGWRKHAWLLADGDQRHTVTVRMRLRDWLMYAVEDPIDARERDLLECARGEDGTVLWAQRRS